MFNQFEQILSEAVAEKNRTGETKDLSQSLQDMKHAIATSIGLTTENEGWASRLDMRSELDRWPVAKAILRKLSGKQLSYNPINPLSPSQVLVIRFESQSRGPNETHDCVGVRGNR